MDTISGSICRACRLRLLKPSHSRAFGTTSPRLYIPPESPAFIDVPQPQQPVREFQPRAKGILPVPRELFPARRPDKPGQQYLDNVTPDPLPKNIPPPDHLTETERYRRRMAELRKAHLRSALKELHTRKTSIDAAIAARSAAKQRERARLLTQPEREDVRLTNVSVPTAMQPQKLHQLSPEEELATYNARSAAHEARLAAKHEERLDKLHTLYMNARTFITDKEQLDAAIEKAFTTTGSIWRKDGRPDTVEEMIKRGRDRTADQGRGGMMLFSDVNERALKDQERLKKIAEKLSGGKL
ncbi:uncharacterized protein Z519_00220 [Cladophialophora bantiana CBS 173.52]|uniref:Uncharacterized protein n=1 Tax=Cladophialophora bantiana (strain ATCC 10958 / CBS 173.52 / CDC B-1940 / NIH 8579) TaxID=1442370 RepID=A0A0D2IP97_CLAB1|nr:uncharacterized protein Z519_00220 [Cladophialophora bantiana CBS 173.52]KIW98559.1 hypothetical protein Z519_00220 [Cladophialophora bantiana CBS 173.52]